MYRASKANTESPVIKQTHNARNYGKTNIPDLSKPSIITA